MSEQTIPPDAAVVDRMIVAAQGQLQDPVLHSRIERFVTEGKGVNDGLQAHGAMQSGRVVRKWGEREKSSHVKEVSARRRTCTIY